MLELINNALNFYISGDSDSSDSSFDMFMSSQINSGTPNGFDLYMNSVPYAGNNTLNLFLSSSDTGSIYNSLELYIDSSTALNNNVELFLKNSSGGTFGDIDEEWADYEVVWGYAPDATDGTFLMTLKGNWFDIASNSLNMFIARNEAESVLFTLLGPGESMVNSVDLYMEANAIIAESVNMVVPGIGVNNDEIVLYTHGF